MLGVYIHNLKDQNGQSTAKGDNPFSKWYDTINGTKTYLSSLYPTYDWVNDNGRQNLGAWIEAAAKKAGR